MDFNQVNCHYNQLCFNWGKHGRWSDGQQLLIRIAKLLNPTWLSKELGISLFICLIFLHDIHCNYQYLQRAPLQKIQSIWMEIAHFNQVVVVTERSNTAVNNFGVRKYVRWKVTLPGGEGVGSLC